MASVIVWALGYFPLPDNPDIGKQEQQEQSYIGRIGKTIEPVFRPMGFDWRLDVGLLAGVGAKEIVASTMGVLYTNNDSFKDDNEYNNESGKYELLRHQMTADIAKRNNIFIRCGKAFGHANGFLFLAFCVALLPLCGNHCGHKRRNGAVGNGACLLPSTPQH